MPLPSPWEDAVLTFGADAKNSAEVDLRASYEFLTVFIPTLTPTATTTVHTCDVTGGTFVPVHRWDADTAGSLTHNTTNANTSMSIVFRIGGRRFIKVVTGYNQTANATFKVQGFNR